MLTCTFHTKIQVAIKICWQIKTPMLILGNVFAKEQKMTNSKGTNDLLTCEN